MIRRVTVLVALTLLLIATQVHADDYTDGEALAKRVYHRADGDDVVIKARMILTEKGHAPRMREFYSYVQDKEDGKLRNLIRFVAPADIKGTALLSLADGKAESDQWLYLPDLGRERRIASQRKGGQFVGSDIYYEDLQDRQVDKDKHRILGKEVIQKVPCTLLESVPVDSSNSTYSKRIACVNLDTLLPLRIDFYRDDKVIKHAETLKIQKVQGYWTAIEQTFTDVATGHQTQVISDVIKYDSGLPDDLFSHQSLEDSSIDNRYRPQ